LTYPPCPNTRAELEYYDRYWDSVSRERSIREDATEEALAQGITQEKRIRMLKALQRGKLTLAEMAEDFEVSLDEVRQVAEGIKAD
jgi:hypothetical protein